MELNCRTLSWCGRMTWLCEPLPHPHPHPPTHTHWTWKPNPTLLGQFSTQQPEGSWALMGPLCSDSPVTPCLTWIKSPSQWSFPEPYLPHTVLHSSPLWVTLEGEQAPALGLGPVPTLPLHAAFVWLAASSSSPLGLCSSAVSSVTPSPSTLFKAAALTSRPLPHSH